MFPFQLRSSFRAFFVCLIGLALRACARAQVSRGTITGCVTDPQGAVAPGAQVVATENGAGAVSKSTSTGAGANESVGLDIQLAAFLGQGVSFYGPKQLNPYSLRWNLDLQRELPCVILLEIGYVGNHGVHLGVKAENHKALGRGKGRGWCMDAAPAGTNSVASNS